MTDHENERIQSNAAAVKRITQAVEIAVHIMSPAWNQQAVVALAVRILDDTRGPLDRETETIREEHFAQVTAPRMTGGM